MADQPTPEDHALARERAMYLSAGRASRVISVDEQLRLRGWMVDLGGDLVAYAPPKPISQREKRPANKAPEQRNG